MSKHFCDRCGADITRPEDHYELAVALTHPRTQMSSQSLALKFRSAGLDLCLTCSREIAKWATTKKSEAVAA